MNTEADKFYYRQLIYKDFASILESLNITALTKNRIEKHKKYINSFDLKGKAKYKTYNLLNSYYNTRLKDDALVSLEFFIIKKCLL
jgi:hypothetical protein